MVGLCLGGMAQAQSILSGEVKHCYCHDLIEKIIVRAFRGDTVFAKDTTNEFGYYEIALDRGLYNIFFSVIDYMDDRYSSVLLENIKIDTSNLEQNVYLYDAKMTEFVTYTFPLVDVDNLTSGQIFYEGQIRPIRRGGSNAMNNTYDRQCDCGKLKKRRRERCEKKRKKRCEEKRKSK